MQLMGTKELTDTMQKRTLTLGEILKYGYALTSQRFGQFMALSVIVYLPVYLISGYISLGIDVQTEDLEVMARSLLKLALTDIVLMFVEIIGMLVTAVIVHNELFGQERLSFGTSFYRGIRAWPKEALTLMFLVIALVLGALITSAAMVVPVMVLFMFPLLMYLLFWFLMHQGMTACACALRGRFGFDSLHYVREVVQNRYYQVLGQFAVVSLLSNLLSTVLSLLISSISSSISAQKYLSYFVNVGLSTAVSILNVFGFVCAALIFLSQEEYTRCEMQRREEFQNRAEQDPWQK